MARLAGSKEQALVPPSEDESLSPDRRQNALRVIIVGDSISQGKIGDWTWRYRFWQWFKQNSVSVQFVGPYDGTAESDQPSQPQPSPSYGMVAPSSTVGANGSYAKGVDADFLTNNKHFSIWGRAAAIDKGLIREVLQQHPADLMLLMLGFNDMCWWYSDALGTIDSIATIVNNARAVNPYMKFAIANVPYRIFLDGREDLVANTYAFNSFLPDSITSWITDQSPIHLVDIAANYDCGQVTCLAGSDGLHPNAWGEYQIARAFSEALINGFEIGSAPLVVPTQDHANLSKPFPTPSHHVGHSLPQGIDVTLEPGIYPLRSLVIGYSAVFFIVLLLLTSRYAYSIRRMCIQVAGSGRSR